MPGCTMHRALGSLLKRRTRLISFVCLFHLFHECSVLMCVADYLIPRRTSQKLCSFWPISLQEPKALTKWVQEVVETLDMFSMPRSSPSLLREFFHSCPYLADEVFFQGETKPTPQHNSQDRLHFDENSFFNWFRFQGILSAKCLVPKRLGIRMFKLSRHVIFSISLEAMRRVTRDMRFPRLRAQLWFPFPGRCWRLLRCQESPKECQEPSSIQQHYLFTGSLSTEAQICGEPKVKLLKRSHRAWINRMPCEYSWIDI